MKLGVFCGSSLGNKICYSDLSYYLGKRIAENRFELVYGGGSIGLMGRLADGVIENGGKVYGVITRQLNELELAHHGITKMYFTETMHERKKKMYDLADAFIALPGGIGTLDELCEVITWNQLRIHKKPCYVLNINRFYDNFIDQLVHSKNEEFFPEDCLSDIIVEKEVDSLLASLDNLSI